MTVTASQLRKLVDVPLNKKDVDLQPFCDAANLIRSEDLAGSGLSSNRLDQIELYLAAHFFTLSIEHGGVTQTKTGSSSESYRTPGANYSGYASTNFGQTAISLDPSGTLIALDSTKKAQFSVIRSTQAPYTRRQTT